MLWQTSPPDSSAAPILPDPISVTDTVLVRTVAEAGSVVETTVLGIPLPLFSSWTASILSIVVGVLTVIYAARAVSEARREGEQQRAFRKKEQKIRTKELQERRNALDDERAARKTGVQSRYYNRTVIDPSYDSIKDFRIEAGALLMEHSRELEKLRRDPKQTALAQIDDLIETTTQDFRTLCLDLRIDLRGAVYSWLEEELLTDVTKVLDDLEDESSQQISTGSKNANIEPEDLGVELRDPVYEKTGELMRTLRLGDPIIPHTDEPPADDALFPDS